MAQDTVTGRLATCLGPEKGMKYVGLVMGKRGEEGLWFGKVTYPFLFESVYCSQAGFLSGFCLPSMLHVVTGVRTAPEIRHPGLLDML